MKIWVTLLISSILIIDFVNAQLQASICEEIIANRKKNGGVNSSQYQNSLQKLKNTIHDKCIIELEPKYVWAQNMTFIMVKFDFDISSRTSCSEVLLSQKDISYHGFSLKQYCLQSDQIIKYEIEVKTYKNLNYHFSRWKQTDMNGIILEAFKSPTPYFWPKLYSVMKHTAKKPQVWWELQQKQDQTVQKYMGLLEIDESEVQISSYVKKMRKKSDKKRKSRNSDIQFYCNQGSPYLLGSWF